MATPHSRPTGKSFHGELEVRTERRTQLLEVTAAIKKMVLDSGVSGGVCHLYVPHTTAGITVNENADPDVARDMEMAFDRMVPQDATYRHNEGNSDSHIKATLVGTSATVFIANKQLELGRWQGIFLCEFDGPRQRQIRIHIVPDPT